MENTSSQEPRWKILTAFAAVYIIWGSTYLGIKFAIETLPPFLMAGSRFIAAGLILFVMMRLRGAASPKWIHWRSAAIVGGLMLLGGNGGVTWAEQHVPSGLAALMVATVPLWIALIDWIRPGGRRPKVGVAIGLALGFAGMMLLAGPGQLAGGKGIDPVGAFVLVLAALAWSLGSLYSRHAELPERALLGTAMEMMAGGIFLALAGTLSGEWARLDLSGISLRSGLALVYLIFFGSIIGFSTYIYLFRVTTPAQASTYAYINPIVAVFLGWALGNEALTPRTLIAAATIIGAVVLITTYQSRNCCL